jgi:hypothetical protein
MGNDLPYSLHPSAIHGHKDYLDDNIPTPPGNDRRQQNPSPEGAKDPYPTASIPPGGARICGLLRVNDGVLRAARALTGGICIGRPIPRR